MQHATVLRGNRVDAADHALRTLEQRLRGLAVHAVAQPAEGGAAYFDAVDGLTGRQGQVELLATVDVRVPVGQLEVIIAPGQPRAVVHARPGGLGDAVGRLPHPLLVVLGIGELDLADRGGRRGQRRRRRSVPAVAMAPSAHRVRFGYCSAGGGIAGQRGHAGRVEQAVIDADLV
ncbi:hypothetical protein D3C71_1165450 [compost metagenome]